MSQRVLISAALVAGVVLASALFAYKRSGAPAPNGPSPARSAATGMNGSAEAAAAAHAAAGVVTAADPAMAAGFAERVASLEHLVAVDPDDLGTRLELARMLHDGHRVAESIPHYAQAIALDPAAAQPYYDLAAAHAALGQWPQAESVLHGRLTLAPDDATALYNLGATIANQGRADEALEWWDKAEQADPPASLLSQIQAAQAQLRTRPDH